MPGFGTVGVKSNFGALFHAASIVPSMAGAVVVFIDTNVVVLTGALLIITWSFFVQLTRYPNAQVTVAITQIFLFLKIFICFEFYSVDELTFFSTAKLLSYDNVKSDASHAGG